MNSKKFKYRINHHLNNLPSFISPDLVYIRAERELGISKEIFDRDRSILAGSDEVVPPRRLGDYAALMNISADDLIEKEG